MSRTRIVVLGAGFGGLELTTRLSEAVGDRIDLTLIDKSDAFVFGFAKLDVMFGRNTPDGIRIPYATIAKPGVALKREVVLAIDPVARHVLTDKARYEADILVVALGADYDIGATPGLVEYGHEFYSVAGAARLIDVIAKFTGGHAVVGVCGKSFKCPPAPSEAALLLHDHLTTRGVRANTTITLVMPFGVPIPPSPETSQVLLATFAERGITFVKDTLVKGVDGRRKVLALSDGSEMPYDLFLGIPMHRVPQVVVESGLAAHAHDWVPVNKQTLETRFPDVYAVGDVNGVGTAKAGVFAEGAAAVVAARIIAQLTGAPLPGAYTGQGLCYIEFGEHEVGKVEVDFLSGPKPVGMFHGASEAVAAEKGEFGASRVRRWFGAAVVSTQRVLPFGPDEVFAAFADPARLARWWGPKGFTNTFHAFDFRPGGRWLFTMHAPTGAQHENENVFREIQRDYRLVIDHVLAPKFSLTVTLTPQDDGTHLRWDQTFETSALAATMRPLVEVANEQNLDRLHAVLAGG